MPKHIFYKDVSSSTLFLNYYGRGEEEVNERKRTEKIETVYNRIIKLPAREFLKVKLYEHKLPIYKTASHLLKNIFGRLWR